MTKTCTTCLKTQSLENFGKHPNGALGKKSRCRKCLSSESLQYFFKKRNVILSKNNARYKKNKKKYRIAMNAWAKKNRDSCVRRQIEWMKKNPDRRRRYRNFNLKIVRPVGSCAYCGLVKQLTVDHIIPICRNGTDTKRNVALVCRNCNSRKHSKTIPEFIEHSRVMGYKLIISDSK